MCVWCGACGVQALALICARFLSIGWRSRACEARMRDGTMNQSKRKRHAVKEAADRAAFAAAGKHVEP